jgi:hypothetical protein
MTVQKESERVEISFGMIGYFFDRIYVLYKKSVGGAPISLLEGRHGACE